MESTIAQGSSDTVLPDESVSDEFDPDESVAGTLSVAAGDETEPRTVSVTCEQPVRSSAPITTMLTKLTEENLALFIIRPTPLHSVVPVNRKRA